jgi:hypothetical protein
MLFTLLTVCSSVNILAGAVLGAKQARAGLGGYSLAIAVGLFLAACNAWGLYKMAEAVEKHVGPAQREWLARALLPVMLVWVLLSVFFGDWLVMALLRLVA